MQSEYCDALAIIITAITSPPPPPASSGNLVDSQAYVLSKFISLITDGATCVPSAVVLVNRVYYVIASLDHVFYAIDLHYHVILVPMCTMRWIG